MNETEQRTKLFDPFKEKLTPIEIKDQNGKLITLGCFVHVSYQQKFGFILENTGIVTRINGPYLEISGNENTVTVNLDTDSVSIKYLLPGINKEILK